MTTFIVELEDKITGKITVGEIKIICNDPKEYKEWYCKKMRRAYLGAKTSTIVSRMYIKN